MAARIPRRDFARPFVVTLAAAPACFTQSSPPQQPQPVEATPTNPPAPAPPPPTSPPPTSPPPTVIANPPRPQPAAPAAGTQWTVFKRGASCEVAVKVECPKAEPGHPQPTCNPPPPRAYTCPEGVSLDAPVTIVSDGSQCMVQREMPHCPPRVMCNPPPPKIVPCP